MSQLPDYDLPTKRDKTKLEEFVTDEKKQVPKSKKKDESNSEWDKLKPKQPEKQDEKPKLNMGKGAKTGGYFPNFFKH